MQRKTVFSDVTGSTALEALHAQADTYADLGEALALAGRREEAAEAIEQALARYEAKESLVRAGWMRERLAKLRAEAGER